MKNLQEIAKGRIRKIIGYLKDRNYEELEVELNELSELMINKSEEFVTNSELKLLILEMREGFKRVDQRFEDLIHYIDKRFEDVYKRFDDINKRFEDINKRFEDMNKRFEDMNKRFEDMNKRFEDMNKRFEDLNKRFSFLQWFIAFIFTVILGFISYFQSENLYTTKEILKEIKELKQITIQKQELQENTIKKLK